MSQESDRIAILIVNFNMPERTNALCKHIQKHVRWPHELIVIDNGSDLVKPSKYTNLWLPENRQTTGGWLAGLKYATAWDDKWLAYWFLITSAEFVEACDTLSPMAQLLIDDENAVGVHPALTEDSTTAWKQLMARGGTEARQTWMIDNIASLYRAEWLDSIDWFDPELKYGWGIDLETCWLARQQGRSLWVHEGARMKKITDIGYTMDRMRMSAEERAALANENMGAVLGERYGPDWKERMWNEYVTDDLR